MAFKRGVWDEPPRFTHDCDRCFYVAPIDLPGEPRHDLWLCRPEDPADRDEFNISVILRYGDDGPEYRSGPLEMWKQQALAATFNERAPALYAPIFEALRVLYTHEWTR